MSKPRVLAEPVLVGRERELEELQSFLNLAVEGKGKTVFISGEAGSGKTRLAREFLNAAVKRGVAVMASWCLSDSQVPYFPFMEAFNNYYAAQAEEATSTSLLQPQAELGLGIPAQVGRTRGEMEITSWLAGQKPPGKAELLSPQAWKDQVFVAVSETLHAIAVQSPVILFIEDAHWADSASLALLHYVARAINNSERILVLATFRSEELTADAEGHPHPLAETMRLMRREELFTEIMLSSLNQASVSKMAESMVGGSLQQELAGKLTTESRGNPLFVVESLRMLYERKSLILENDEWRLAIDELAIPNKIKDIILRRLACLKYVQRRVLDAASVIGEEFDVELLSTVLEQDVLDVLETLNVIAHSTSLVGVEENRYRFDHARSRETIYEELSLPLKRGYHSRIAEKLESTRGAALPLSDLAYHYAQAGNKEKSLKYALAAAKDELARFSNSQAINHFTYVLRNIPDGRAEEKRTALEGLGDAYAANYMYEKAIKTFDELAASETGAVRLRALRKAMEAAFHESLNTPNKIDLLVEYSRKAEELAVDDRLEMARVLNNRGAAGKADWRNQLEDFEAALQIFEEENSITDAAEALWRSGLASTLYENLPEKGLGELLRSVAIFRELGDVRKEVEATLFTGIGLSNIGLFSEARSEFVNVLRIGEKLDVFSELAMACDGLGELYEHDGELAEAVSQSFKALEYLKKTDVSWIQGITFDLTRRYAKLGDLKQMDEYFDKMTKLSPEILSSEVHDIIWVARSKAAYFAAKARWEESNKCFEKVIEFFTTTGPGNEICAREDYAWALFKQGRAEEARDQLDRVQKLLKQADERFRHANLQLGLMVQRKVQVGEEFEMRLDLVNVGRKPASPVRVEGLNHPEFSFFQMPASCKVKEGSLSVKDKTVGPFEVETLKLKLSATKAGSYSLNPEIVYFDDLGHTKTFRLDPITITAQPAKPDYEVLPGRVTTGTMGLDRLLLGGIPEKLAVVLNASSSDERQQIIKRFLEAGISGGETTLYVTCEVTNVGDLAQTNQSNLSLIVCSLQADLIIQDQTNVYKLKGIENLTDIDIALTKYLRTPNLLEAKRKRACIDLLSDVLLQHHAVITRKWLNSLILNLKSKGFTILAVINPLMHPPEEFQAILSQFDGEIRMVEKETATGMVNTLRVLKLQGQSYLKDELILG